MYCIHCGAEINDSAVVCVKCGCSVTPKSQIKMNPAMDPTVSDKDWLVTMLLCIFVGNFGVHRFFVGKIGTGIAMLLTLGGCGIWTIIDFILIVMGNFTDEDGKFLKNKS